jgi:hypothetical protein
METYLYTLELSSVLKNLIWAYVVIVSLGRFADVWFMVGGNRSLSHELKLTITGGSNADR